MFSISEHINNAAKMVQFNGTNFSNWKYRIGILLDEKGLRRYIEEKLDDILAGTDASSRDAVRKEEKSCVSIIVQSVHDSQLEYIKDKTLAKDMFDGLTAVFERKSIAGQLLLRKQLLTMKMSDGASMSEHFLHFDKSVRELKSIGAKMEEMDVICHLLLTLPKSYDNLVTALETMNPKDLTLEFVKSRLLDENVKRNSGGSSSKPSESHAMHVRNPDIVCFRCGKKGHVKSMCKSKVKKKKSTDSDSNKKSESANATSSSKNEESILCAIDECDEIQHANACGVPVMSKTCKNTNERVKHIRLNRNDDSAQIKFILDSGATEHMVSSDFKHHFSELAKIDKLNISVAKRNEKMTAKHRGSLKVKTINGDCKTKTISNVLVIDDLKCNLLSINVLTNRGYTIDFRKECAYVMLDEKLQFIAHKNGRLYEVIFQLDDDFAGISGDQCDSKISQDLLHFRLGHLNVYDMHKLISRQMVSGLKPTKIDTNAKFCESCVYGKQTRTTFPPNKNSRSSRILELIHSDVSGPMSEPAWDGSEYFVTFTDDFSRASMVYCIKRKSDVFDKFKEYVSMAEARHGCKISALKTDNGGEYTSNEFKRYCRERGIRIVYTVPHNPEMNAVSERLNRILQEKARTMLLACGIEWHFWNEAVMTANYLKNRSPTSAFGKQFANKTPAEIWYGNKPDLSNIRIFGSTCYNLVPAVNRKKLDAKSSKCIMLGYGSSLHTYRLWDVNANKLVFGRHVTFNEGSVLNKPKLIEIANSEAVGQSTVNGKNDEMPDEKDDDDFEDANDTAFDRDDDGNGTENVGADIHSTERQGTGNNKKVHGATDGTGDIEVRRGTRVRKPVDRYGEWEYDAHFALSAQQYVQDDPVSIADAKQRPDWPNWKRAIDEEYSSLIKSGTWSLCNLPKGRRTISCKWVFKLKHKANGEIDKYKARLVARGFTQEKGFDYNETYSPTAKLTTFRVLMAIANHFGYHVHQMDVKCAFLNGQLKEEIYMNQPEGFKDGTWQVCKLRRSLYGLKQASRMWNERFNQFMLRIGFKGCLSDYCLYVRVTNGIACYVLLYVDDLLIVSSDLRSIETIKRLLSNEFEMTDVGEADTFLGVHIERDNINHKISMSQVGYFEKVLRKFNMIDCKAVSTPIESGIDLQKGESNQDCNAPYRELMGCLTYATITTRPDLCAATNYFSRFQSCYGDEHFKHAKRMLRYIRGTMNLKLVYGRRNDAEPLIGYADADWAGDKNDRKSTSGYVYKVFGNTVSWCSRKQPTVSLSSTEAEYIALSNAICEGKWLRSLLSELGIDSDRATIVYEDNQSCIRVADEPREHKRMKHIDVKYNFIRESIASGEFKLEYIPTGDQVADIMTKGLGQQLFVKHRLNLELA